MPIEFRPIFSRGGGGGGAEGRGIAPPPSPTPPRKIIIASLTINLIFLTPPIKQDPEYSPGYTVKPIPLMCDMLLYEWQVTGIVINAL